MAWTKGVILLLAGAFALATRPSLASAAEPQGSAPADDRPVALERPWTVTVGLERVLFIGPYAQSGPSGEAGISIAGGGYILADNIEDTEPFLPHAVPRLAVDIVLVERFTFGVAAGYGASVADARLRSRAREPQERVTGTGVLSARFGYVGAMRYAGFYGIRLGFLYGFGTCSYTYPESGSEIEASMSYVATNLELLLGTVPLPYAAVTFGLSTDVGLHGTHAWRVGSSSAGTEEPRLHHGIGIWMGGLLIL
jgi:hypothetical protein